MNDITTNVVSTAKNRIVYNFCPNVGVVITVEGGVSAKILPNLKKMTTV
jgi:hypothetical protein